MNLSLPSGVTTTLDFIDQLDQCWLVGFANLNPTHWQTLASLQKIFTGTPLASRLQTACEALDRHEFMADYFLTLAIARASLQGALHGALQQQVNQALARPAISSDLVNQATLPSDEVTSPRLDSIRQWLMEVALAGFGQLEATTLTPFLPTLEQLQIDPNLIRPATLLTGWLDELFATVPIADSRQIPLYRWGDLWTRAMIATLPQPTWAAETVSGEIQLLGLELRQHDHMVTLMAYGILLTPSPRLVRLTQARYKVEVIHDKEIWLFLPQAEILVTALAKRQTLQISGETLWPTGDLLWSGQATLGATYDMATVAATHFSPNAATPCQPLTLWPSDRHPVQLAEMVWLTECKVQEIDNTLHVNYNETTLRIATEQLDPLLGLDEATLRQATAMLGWLRFEAGAWAVQPLVVVTKVKNKPKIIASGENGLAVFQKPPKTDTIAVLQERASRLLRK